MSVRTHEFFAPHLATRKELYIYENTYSREGGSEEAQNAKCVILDRNFLREPENLVLDRLLKRGYAIQHEHDGFYVLTKRS